MSAVRQATSRKAREVAHPHFFLVNIQQTLYFPCKRGPPTTRIFTSTRDPGRLIYDNRCQRVI